MDNALIRAIKAIYDRFMDRFTPDAAGLIGSLSKLEVQIEKSINKSSRDLAQKTALIRQLELDRANGNADLDRCYKLLHKVSDLTS